MLDKTTIESKTFGLMKLLMTDPAFNIFFLVGGTSIALNLGHRKSIDIDLFTQENFDVQELGLYLKEKYQFAERYKAKNTLKGDINDVFIDCIKYDYPLIKPLTIEEEIRIASMEDVCAMKLSAITNDGTRLKDFVDIAYLSSRFSLQYMLECYCKKYEENNIISPIKALQYFDEIDFQGEPVQLCGARFDWNKIKLRLTEMIKNPNKVFPSFPIEKTNINTHNYER